MAKFRRIIFKTQFVILTSHTFFIGTKSHVTYSYLSGSRFRQISFLTNFLQVYELGRIHNFLDSAVIKSKTYPSLPFRSKIFSDKS